MRLLMIAIVTLLISLVNAQTTVNPDISVIGALTAHWENDELTLYGSSVELAFQGYVNPYARVDVFLHKHMDGHPIETEEAVLSIERGLPFGLALRTGKLRPDFGKINGQHLHTFPQIVLPVPAGQILGEEKWAASGLEIKWLLPLPWYSNLSFDYLQNGISAHHHHDASSDEAEEPMPGPALSTRYSVFFDLGSMTHLETGLNYYQLVDQAEINIKAFDLKLKWRPDKYRSLVWQSELFQRSAHAHIDDGVLEEHPAVLAAYSLVNYQFSKVWNTGFIVDYSSELETAEYHSEGVFLGYSPAEETTVLRLFLKRSRHGAEEADIKILAQMLWSLGPHKAHLF